MSCLKLVALAVLLGFECLSPIHAQQVTQQAKLDTGLHRAILLQISPGGIKVATTQEGADQLSDHVPEHALLIACRELRVSASSAGTGQTGVQVDCVDVTFGTGHHLEGRADRLQYDAQKRILTLLHGELIVDRYRDDPPDKISAREITVRLEGLRVELADIRIDPPEQPHPAPQDGPRASYCLPSHTECPTDREGEN